MHWSLKNPDCHRFNCTLELSLLEINSAYILLQCPRRMNTYNSNYIISFFSTVYKICVLIWRERGLHKPQSNVKCLKQKKKFLKISKFSFKFMKKKKRKKEIFHVHQADLKVNRMACGMHRHIDHSKILAPIYPCRAC